MTVCIGAICDTGMIVGATDTMLTVGDVEFEPQWAAEPRVGKVFTITNSIVAMAAGAMGIQAEIVFRYVHPAVNRWLKANPDKWLPVEEAVQIYCDSYNLFRHERMERVILHPFGLTYEKFLVRQKEMSADFLSRITRSMADFSLDATETIITGVEPGIVAGRTLSRLFSVERDNAVCHDTVRFASIGGGSRHADSHFMQSRHGPKATAGETLLSVYTAKKKSEVAPGVGHDTNIFAIGPGLGSFNWVKTEVHKELNSAYQKSLKEQRRSILRANNRIAKYLEDLIKRGRETKQQTG